MCDSNLWLTIPTPGDPRGSLGTSKTGRGFHCEISGPRGHPGNFHRTNLDPGISLTVFGTRIRPYHPGISLIEKLSVILFRDPHFTYTVFCKQSDLE